MKILIIKKSLHNTCLKNVTSSTQNETTLKGSEVEYVKKNSLAALPNHLKPHLIYFLFFYFYSLLWLSSMTSKKFESDKISTKSITANHWSISTLQQLQQKQYYFQTIHIYIYIYIYIYVEPNHHGKISLNFNWHFIDH